MQNTIKLLVQLQQTDSVILEKRKLIETAPRRISKADEPLRVAKGELEKSVQRSEALASARRDRERLLEETNDKVRKLKARSSDIKTNKEYQALLKEIESYEKDAGKMEEELIRMIDEIAGLGNEIKEKQRILQDEESRLKDISNAIGAETSQLQSELSDLKTERTRIADGLEADIYNKYLDLLMKGGGTAVSLVDDEICLGCNMNIPPQLFVQVRKGTEIVQCPQCDRILYCTND